MRKYRNIYVLLILWCSPFLKAQSVGYLKQLQGFWKHQENEKSGIEFVKVTGNFWYSVYYYKRPNNIYIANDAEKSDTTIIHFIEECPDETNSCKYIINDSTGNNFAMSIINTSCLCYNFRLLQDFFSLQWSKNMTSIFDYYRINMHTIGVDKAMVYNEKKQVTKKYLIKGDEVEIIKEKNEWIEIRYYGNQILDGWIRKTDILL